MGRDMHAAFCAAFQVFVTVVAVHAVTNMGHATDCNNGAAFQASFVAVVH